MNALWIIKKKQGIDNRNLWLLLMFETRQSVNGSKPVYIKRVDLGDRVREKWLLNK